MRCRLQRGAEGGFPVGTEAALAWAQLSAEEAHAHAIVRQHAALCEVEEGPIHARTCPE